MFPPARSRKRPACVFMLFICNITFALHVYHKRDACGSIEPLIEVIARIEKLLLILKVSTINIKLNFEPFYSFAIKP
jgi:hypothetical protein